MLLRVSLFRKTCFRWGRGGGRRLFHLFDFCCSGRGEATSDCWPCRCSFKHHGLSQDKHRVSTYACGSSSCFLNVRKVNTPCKDGWLYSISLASAVYIPSLMRCFLQMDGHVQGNSITKVIFIIVGARGKCIVEDSKAECDGKLPINDRFSLIHFQIMLWSCFRLIACNLDVSMNVWLLCRVRAELVRLAVLL